MCIDSVFGHNYGVRKEDDFQSCRPSFLSKLPNLPKFTDIKKKKKCNDFHEFVIMQFCFSDNAIKNADELHRYVNSNPPCYIDFLAMSFMS